jgi:hypothetical protein
VGAVKHRLPGTPRPALLIHAQQLRQNTITHLCALSFTPPLPLLCRVHARRQPATPSGLDPDVEAALRVAIKDASPAFHDPQVSA